MDGELPRVAQPAGLPSVLLQTFGIPEGYERRIQGCHFSRPGGDGHRGPGEVDLFAGIGALHAHVIGVVFGAESDPDNSRRGGRQLVCGHDGPGVFNPWDQLNLSCIHSRRRFHGGYHSVRVPNVVRGFDFAQADPVEVRGYHRR